MKKSLVILIFVGTYLLAACSYDSEKALENGDVINMNGPVYNFERFEQFLGSVEAEESAAVRISNFTLEGNPTLYNLTFDGTRFDIEIDSSKNKNRGDHPAKMKMSCTDLVSEEGQQLVTYTLEGCQQGDTSDSFNLLNVLKEDEHDHDDGF
ncbi:DUF4362 domain-containing protein [Sporosarcina aquimarina]|uniref:DUF4362 domain-containing protein n=1 Tax=Sporosarcina aquimarina TaxID=114975 RepID=A0ABU4G1V9_9BACL|nr:DUF4362 domain-containing protein [Sporosarcina aquimarina]MDW0110954.1 DUF4362 domain-containing protein [Sporosarcina aquimarina]